VFYVESGRDSLLVVDLLDILLLVVNNFGIVRLQLCHDLLVM